MLSHANNNKYYQVPWYTIFNSNITTEWYSIRTFVPQLYTDDPYDYLGSTRI